MILRRSEITLAKMSTQTSSTVFVALVTLLHYSDNSKKQIHHAESKVVGVYHSCYIAEMAARRCKDMYDQNQNEQCVCTGWDVCEAEVDK